MTLHEVSNRIKKEFSQISNEVFNCSLNIQYTETINSVFAEASPMFGLRIIRYGESNFEYFYLLHKILLANFDLLTLKTLKLDFIKFGSSNSDNILSIPFIKRAIVDDYENTNSSIFFELNLISNLFVFFHECGHINQDISTEDITSETNHFSEFNSDFYAFYNILKYYYNLRKIDNVLYYQRSIPFQSEQHFIRCVIVASIIVVYFECLSSIEDIESISHPTSKNRLCYLFCQMETLLENNFDFLFVEDTLKDFLTDIIKTLDFIKSKMFSNDFISPFEILGDCISSIYEIKNLMKHHIYFKKFNN